MDDLLREFLTETSENIAQVDVELVRLEKTPNDPALLGSIFRLVHTIKGTCGFLGLPRLERVAHASENILGRFRDGELEVTPQAVTLILRSIDSIKLLLAFLEECEAEQPGNDDELIGDLNAMAEGHASLALGTAIFEQQPSDETVSEPSITEVMAALTAEPPVTASGIIEGLLKTPIELKPEGKPAGDEHLTKDSTVANQSIRVDVGLLENLMTTVSELVLTRNQLLQILRVQEDTSFTVPLQRLNQVTSELQESVMKTRMQPIGNAWSKLPRIIRDLSLELGKKIGLFRDFWGDLSGGAMI